MLTYIRLLPQLGEEEEQNASSNQKSSNRPRLHAYIICGFDWPSAKYVPPELPYPIEVFSNRSTYHANKQKVMQMFLGHNRWAE